MIKIRPIQEEDAEKLRDLYVSIINEKLPYILENSPPSVEKEKEFIREVLSSNPAIGLYKRLNFRKIGENHRGIKVKGIYQTVVTMALNIDYASD